MKYGYARVSTDDQNADMQHRALKRAGCRTLFTDERTEATAQRPALLRCLKRLQRGDMLIVWKLDRVARNLRDLVAMIENFEQCGVHFRSLTEQIDTTTPGGKLTFHIFAALAEFERGLIIERTRGGMKAARGRGVKFGRKPKLSPAQLAHARQLISSGNAVPEVAGLLGVARATVYRRLAA